MKNIVLLIYFFIVLCLRLDAASPLDQDPSIGQGGIYSTFPQDVNTQNREPTVVVNSQRNILSNAARAQYAPQAQYPAKAQYASEPQNVNSQNRPPIAVANSQGNILPNAAQAQYAVQAQSASVLKNVNTQNRQPVAMANSQGNILSNAAQAQYASAPQNVNTQNLQPVAMATSQGNILSNAAQAQSASALKNVYTQNRQPVAMANSQGNILSNAAQAQYASAPQNVRYNNLAASNLQNIYETRPNNIRIPANGAYTYNYGATSSANTNVQSNVRNPASISASQYNYRIPNNAANTGYNQQVTQNQFRQQPVNTVSQTVQRPNTIQPSTYTPNSAVPSYDVKTTDSVYLGSSRIHSNSQKSGTNNVDISTIIETDTILTNALEKVRDELAELVNINKVQQPIKPNSYSVPASQYEYSQSVLPPNAPAQPAVPHIQLLNAPLTLPPVEPQYPSQYSEQFQQPAVRQYISPATSQYPPPTATQTLPQNSPMAAQQNYPMAAPQNYPIAAPQDSPVAASQKDTLQNSPMAAPSNAQMADPVNSPSYAVQPPPTAPQYVPPIPIQSLPVDVPQLVQPISTQPQKMATPLPLSQPNDWQNKQGDVPPSPINNEGKRFKLLYPNGTVQYATELEVEQIIKQSKNLNFIRKNQTENQSTNINTADERLFKPSYSNNFETPGSVNNGNQNNPILQNLSQSQMQQRTDSTTSAQAAANSYAQSNNFQPSETINKDQFINLSQDSIQESIDSTTELNENDNMFIPAQSAANTYAQTDTFPPSEKIQQDLLPTTFNQTVPQIDSYNDDSSLNLIEPVSFYSKNNYTDVTNSNDSTQPETSRYNIINETDNSFDYSQLNAKINDKNSANISDSNDTQYETIKSDKKFVENYSEDLFIPDLLYDYGDNFTDINNYKTNETQSDNNETNFFNYDDNEFDSEENETSYDKEQNSSLIDNDSEINTTENDYSYSDYSNLYPEIITEPNEAEQTTENNEYDSVEPGQQIARSELENEERSSDIYRQVSQTEVLQYDISNNTENSNPLNLTSILNSETSDIYYQKPNDLLNSSEINTYSSELKEHNGETTASSQAKPKRILVKKSRKIRRHKNSTTVNPNIHVKTESDQDILTSTLLPDTTTVLPDTTTALPDTTTVLPDTTTMLQETTIPATNKNKNRDIIITTDDEVSAKNRKHRIAPTNPEEYVTVRPIIWVRKSDPNFWSRLKQDEAVLSIVYQLRLARDGEDKLEPVSGLHNAVVLQGHQSTQQNCNCTTV